MNGNENVSRGSGAEVLGGWGELVDDGEGDLREGRIERDLGRVGAEMSLDDGGANRLERYHSWQVECLEKIKQERDVILSSPTGSGKTAVFMEWAKDKRERAVADGRNHTVYITAPIKALSNQRFRELKEQGYKVGLETGDVKDNPGDADYVCCTQEIYTNKFVDDEDATLIIDEFHYIFENEDRSRAYIDGIHNSKAENTLICSGTFGDMAAAKEYVDKVTGKEYCGYENTERLTELKIEGKIDIEDIKDALVVSFSQGNCQSVARSIVCARKYGKKEYYEPTFDYDGRFDGEESETYDVETGI